MDNAGKRNKPYLHTIGLLSIIVGLVLTAITIYFVPMAVVQTWRSWFADFPCDYYSYPQRLVQPETRIAYCFDFVGRYVVSGAGIYTQGITSQDQIVIDASDHGFGSLNLERHTQSLMVNGLSISIGQSSSKSIWYFSQNPWLLFANHLTVRNDGLSDSTNALLISGEVSEGWLLNPLAPCVLILGILLIITGKEIRRSRKQLL